MLMRHYSKRTNGFMALLLALGHGFGRRVYNTHQWAAKS